jgi:hypothetical protein
MSIKLVPLSFPIPFPTWSIWYCGWAAFFRSLLPRVIVGAWMKPRQKRIRKNLAQQDAVGVSRNGEEQV